MAYHQKFIKIFLSFVIAISPVLFINSANASLGGWALKNPVARGAMTIFGASSTKMFGGKAVQATSELPINPIGARIVKVLVEGGTFVALSVAVEQLLGAVDWVMDPANNQIKYYETDAALPPNNCATDKKLTYSGVTGSISQVVAKLTQEQTVRKSGSYAFNTISVTAISCSSSNVEITYSGYYCTSSCSPSVNYPYGNAPITGRKAYAYVVTGTVDREQKTLPLDAVAAQIISNANSGDTDAQAVTIAAAQDIVNEAEQDEAKAAPLIQILENNIVYETSGAATGEGTTTTETTTNPETGEVSTKDKTDLALEFPTFCGWAPTICQAAQTVISFPQTLTNWWDTANTKANEWALAISEAWAEVKELTEVNEQTDTELDIPDIEQETTDTNISFDDSCPAPITLANFSWHGSSQNWQVDFSQLCDSLTTYVKPIVIAMASFTAVLIVSGVRTDE